MTTEYLSYSQVQTLKDCGEQFRLRYVDHAERRPNAAAVGGTAVHAATEFIDAAILTGVRDPERLKVHAQSGVEEALASELAKIEKHTPDYVDPATWINYGRKSAAWPNAQDLSWFRMIGIPNAIENYISWRLKTLDLMPLEIDGFGPAIEYPVEWKLDGRKWHGVIDRIFQHVETGACTILDIKNGPKPKTSSQLGCYRLAMQQQDPTRRWKWGNYLTGLKYDPNPVTPKKGAPSRKPQQMRLSMPVDLEYWTEERLEASNDPAVRAMDQGIYIPNPGEACALCPFTDVCEFFGATLV